MSLRFVRDRRVLAFALVVGACSTLQWAVAGPSWNGSISPGTSTTDAAGIARTTYAAGTLAGPKQIRAQLNTSVSREFSFTVLPGPLCCAGFPSGVLNLRVGSSFSATVKALDRFANGIPGVTFVTGPGTIVNTALTTSPLTPSTRVWNPPSIPGTYTMTARTAAPNEVGSPLIFTLKVIP